MTEPDMNASDAELADYYDRHRDEVARWKPEPVRRPDRLDVTISVRFTRDEIAAVRQRARAVGLKPTTFIRQAVLDATQPPIDREAVRRHLAAAQAELR